MKTLFTTLGGSTVLRGVATVLLLGLGSAGCGGLSPEEAPSARYAIAPLWMAELDLPGCDALAAGPSGWHLLGHPQDTDLAIVVSGSTAICVGLESDLVAAAGQPQVAGAITHPSAAYPWPSDDPVPLAKDGSEGEKGLTSDDPIPLARDGSSAAGGSQAASDQAEDEPIPLARPRRTAGKSAL